MTIFLFIMLLWLGPVIIIKLCSIAIMFFEKKEGKYYKQEHVEAIYRSFIPVFGLMIAVTVLIELLMYLFEAFSKLGLPDK